MLPASYKVILEVQTGDLTGDITIKQQPLSEQSYALPQ